MRAAVLVSTLLLQDRLTVQVERGFPGGVLVTVRSSVDAAAWDSGAALSPSVTCSVLPVARDPQAPDRRQPNSFRDSSPVQSVELFRAGGWSTLASSGRTTSVYSGRASGSELDSLRITTRQASVAFAVERLPDWQPTVDSIGTLVLRVTEDAGLRYRGSLVAVAPADAPRHRLSCRFQPRARIRLPRTARDFFRAGAGRITVVTSVSRSIDLEYVSIQLYQSRATPVRVAPER